ncbi:L-lactate oxidase-like [Dermacentor albipictus]|uniref:L-lactate oxidase-like n=1 Tax=Dermacentor albipictus TaxID=60249 RepID=UPI0038FC75A4
MVVTSMAKVLFKWKSHGKIHGPQHPAILKRPLRERLPCCQCWCRRAPRCYQLITTLRFRPKVLVDVSKIDTATVLLGRRISFPVGFAPTAAQMIADQVGELGTAQAARDAGTVMIVSCLSTMSLEDIRASAPDCLLWQQTYLLSNRSLTKAIVKRAEEQNVAAIVVTVDSNADGQAASLRRKKFVLPHGLRVSCTFGICREVVAAFPSEQAEMGLRAYKNGASAVMVSNHGGRVLDDVPAALDALPEVVAAVGNRMEVYMDGGVRSGADAVKALSLGARAVFIGRPIFWGLAYRGKQGVDKVLDILRSEFNLTIRLLGVPDAKNLCTNFVVREQYYSQPLHKNSAPRQPRVD